MMHVDEALPAAADGLFCKWRWKQQLRFVTFLFANAEAPPMDIHSISTLRHQPRMNRMNLFLQQSELLQKNVCKPCRASFRNSSLFQTKAYVFNRPLTDVSSNVSRLNGPASYCLQIGSECIGWNAFYSARNNVSSFITACNTRWCNRSFTSY